MSGGLAEWDVGPCIVPEHDARNMCLDANFVCVGRDLTGILTICPSVTQDRFKELCHFRRQETWTMRSEHINQSLMAKDNIADVCTLHQRGLGTILALSASA